MKKLNEGLDYHDLESMIQPTVSVDEYSSKLGKDSEIVTLSFIVNSKQAGDDLADWFERGYEWVLDAEVSEGELTVGKYVVFVEMSRRSTVPAHIVELLDDLDTLTNLSLEEWTVMIDGEEYDADEEALKQVITISPHEYRETEDTSEDDAAADALNEMRAVAGLPAKRVHLRTESIHLRNVKILAGL